MVNPLPGNEEIWRLLTLTKGQWRLSQAGVFALDLTPILMAAERLGIPMTWTLLAKVQLYEETALSIFNPPQGEHSCSETQRSQCAIEFGEYLEWTCKQCKEMKRGQRGKA
jgi:hypothetical protein